VWTDIVNARIGWQDIKVGSAALKVMAYGKNLANKHNPLFSATSGQWASADPRTYGLEVSADF